MNIAEILQKIANNEELVEIGRRAIEDRLIEMRDDRVFLMGRGNGLVVREKNGEASSRIRMGPETAFRIALLAIAESKQLEKQIERNATK